MAAGKSRTLFLENVRAFAEVFAPPSIAGRGRRQPRGDAARHAGPDARLPHHRDRRPAALRHHASASRTWTISGSACPSELVQQVPLIADHRAGAGGPRLQVRPAGAAPRAEHAGGLHRAPGLAAGAGRPSSNLLREDGVSEEALLARAGADRPRPGRPVGARDRAGVLAEILAVQRRRHRHADQREGAPRAQVTPMKATRGPARATATAGALEGARSPATTCATQAGKVAIAKGPDARRGGRGAAARRCRGRRCTCSSSSRATCTRSRPARAWPPRPAAGDGVEVKGYTGGQWTLAATRRGLVRRQRGARWPTVNAHEGMSVFTLYDLAAGGAGRGRGPRQDHAAGHPGARS